MKHELCQLRVQLRDVRPLIWREILVPPAMKLTHSYRFESGSNVPLSRSWSSAPVGKVFTITGGPLIYLYDPGDGWEHEITLEERVSCDVETDYDLHGWRACVSPEDWWWRSRL